jgi:hypothetical protein
VDRLFVWGIGGFLARLFFLKKTGKEMPNLLLAFAALFVLGSSVAWVVINLKLELPTVVCVFSLSIKWFRICRAFKGRDIEFFCCFFLQNGILSRLNFFFWGCS